MASSPKLNVLNTALMSVHSGYHVRRGQRRIGVSGDDWSKAPLVHICSIRERQRYGFIIGGNAPLRWISSWNTAGSSWHWKSKAGRTERKPSDWRNSQRTFHLDVPYSSVKAAFRFQDFYRSLL